MLTASLVGTAVEFYDFYIYATAAALVFGPLFFPSDSPSAQLMSSYATFAIGKWHLTPRDQRSPSGPFENWPLGKGFEHYYGFLSGDANHWAPELIPDNTYVDPPRTPHGGPEQERGALGAPAG